MKRCATAVLALTALTAPTTASRVAAQRGWLPRENRIHEITLLTAAEKAAVVARLNEIERILVLVPELAQPRGFEVRATLHPGQSFRRDRQHLVAYSYTLSFHTSPRTAGQSCACLEITVNAAPSAMHASTQPVLHDAQGDIYYEPQRGRAIPGATHVYGVWSQARDSRVTVVLTEGRESPWRVVTREEFLKAAIAAVEGNSKAVIAHRNALAKTPYQQWLAEAPRRRQAREARIASVERLLSPREIANLRKTLEETERAVGAQLKASESEDRAAAAKLLAAPRPGDRFRSQLAALSAAERAQPAWVAEVDLDRLVEPGAPDARRVVRPNLNLYRADRSPVEARSILIRITSPQGGDPATLSHALGQAYRKLDWRALARLLEQPAE